VKQRKNCSWVQFLTGRFPIKSVSHGSVATIALLKSQPTMVTATEAALFSCSSLDGKRDFSVGRGCNLMGNIFLL